MQDLHHQIEYKHFVQWLDGECPLNLMEKSLAMMWN